MQEAQMVPKVARVTKARWAKAKKATEKKPVER
jgi:hypothetical protein